MKRRILTILLLVTSNCIFAQAPGVPDLYQAANDIQSLFTPMKELCFSLGAVVGLVGGLRVFIVWNHGDHHVNIIKLVVSWFGASLFLILVPIVLEGLFN